jgi:ATP-dependent Clp protease ATP-binding subunit ClpA
MATPDLPMGDVFQPGGGIRPDLLSDKAAQALREAIRLARETRWESVRSPHIFMGLLAYPDAGVTRWGARLKADLTELLDKFQEMFEQKEQQGGATLLLNREFLSDNAIRILREARQRACDHRRKTITPMDLLITLLTTSNSIVAECFERAGLTAAKVTEMAVIAEQQADS